MNRDYIFYAYTKTLCSVCQQLIDGKIVYNATGAYVWKNCPRHGQSLELLEEDYQYHLDKARFDKPGTVIRPDTKSVRGCPYDCGLCPVHDQHSCIALIEITQRCNLNCDVCFASAGQGKDLELGQIEAMMDFLVTAEDHQAEILQISGGEPTIHPDILKIIDMGKAKGFKYVMLNTNGIRIAEDEAFVRELSAFKGGFEVYLQFDGLTDDIYQKLRGKSLAAMKTKALGNLAKYGVPVTLVCTVVRGVNDQALGEILVYGMNGEYIRGVNFQPVAFFGRIDEDRKESRITLSGILNRIEAQTGKLIRKSDFMPLPCNVERVALTYLLKDRNGFVPVTRNKDMADYKDYINNTFMFSLEDTLKDLKDANVTFGLADCCDLLRDIKSCLPKGFIFRSREEKMQFVDENTFRISVSSFVDIYNFDMKSVQKECVHIVTPDLKRIPFSVYNMLRRGDYDEYYV